MTGFAIIGCGFVADLYMRSFALYDDVRLLGVHDRDADRLALFAKHWDLQAHSELGELLASLPKGSIVLNLTNPHEHFQVSKACLEAGLNVYSEKPLATEMEDARALHDLAEKQGLMLASAPCSVLGEAAQTLGYALRKGIAGTPRLVYAELDDGFIPQAPYRDWQSDTGAPWPAEDEFRVGCTLEHAGYYLTWLIAYFGPVKRVVAAAADLVPDKPTDGHDAAPDFTVGTLYFQSGVVARLTCSIVATHDHRIRIFGDNGVLSVEEAWNNAAKVRFTPRRRIRRRLVEGPFKRRIRLGRKTHPKIGRWGAASMNFALGPMEMRDAIDEGRRSRLAADFALHLNEVTLAIQAGEVADMETTCGPVAPMPWAEVA